MKWQDIKIATQLRLGMGAIMALVLAFGIFAWRQTHQIWLGTQMMYNHPLQVRAAVGSLDADIKGMELEARNLALAKTDEDRRIASDNDRVLQTDVRRQLQRLRGLYLGPLSDVDAAENAFSRWLSARGDLADHPGATASADTVARREQVLDWIQRIDIHARNNADQLYQTSTEQSDAMKLRLSLTVLLILLLSLSIAGWLIKGLRIPLKDLMAATEQFRRGHLEVRSRYESLNELGVLSAAFNTMADELQTQAEVNEHEAELAKIMLQEDELHAFCRELLKGLLKHTGSQIGAVYLQNDTKSALQHFESIGLGAGGRAAFAIAELEGELGMALATREIQHIKQIPGNSRFTFAAVSGNFVPQEILTIPVLSGSAVIAVISLASLHCYDDAAMRLIHEIWSVLTARINGVLAFRKIHSIAEQLEQQNHELGDQQRELAKQAQELSVQNTELEIQKQQLFESNRLKSTFLSNMSHELRTPLNSVIALSGVLNRRLANLIPAEEYGYLEVIQRNGRNLLDLINNILDLSRIEAGHEALNLRSFTVDEWVGEIVAMLEPLANEKNIELVTDLAAELPRLRSDPDKCRHVLQNLVANALKFTAAGSVEIAAMALDGKLLVTVKDSGIGIDAQHLPHIFDEFRQADDSTSRKYGGTGLGLAIAQKYSILLGGGITVESTPGQGSCFTLSLPMDRAVESGGPAEPLIADALRGDARPLPAATASGGHGKTLLLVEDNDPVIVQLSDILLNQGYQLQVARNGREALAAIHERIPDAMILDLMMPEVDGFQVLQAIRSEAKTAAVPVLILTAKHVTREEISTLNGNHIHQLIQKGDIRKSELLDAVARMMRRPAGVIRARRRRGPGELSRVLVIEDNPDNLRTACALLSEHYEVLTAEDGPTGLQQAKEHQPDIVLTDIAIPGMDGFMVLDALRQDETLRDVPVVAVTANAMKGHREQILHHGFDAYISKPIDEPLLIATLEELLATDPRL